MIAEPLCESSSICSIAGQSSSLIQTKPLRSWVCAIWKMRCSASSRSCSTSDWFSKVAWTMEVAASISRRSTAFSRTMRAWYSMLAAVGTASISCARYAAPPTASKSPAFLRCSESVTTSMTSPCSQSRTMER